MSFNVNNPYFRTKVLTASPEQLRLYLIEGAIHFLKEGRQALVDKNFEAVFENFRQARAIVIELMNALRPEVDPELCARLSGIYTFVHNEVTMGSFEKNIERIDQAIELMEYDRETWTLLLDKLAEEREKNAGGGTTLVPAEDVNHADADAAAPRVGISLHG